jgi:hypothetical protein
VYRQADGQADQVQADGQAGGWGAGAEAARGRQAGAVKQAGGQGQRWAGGWVGRRAGGKTYRYVRAPY